jgi:hypothetical protein
VPWLAVGGHAHGFAKEMLTGESGCADEALVARRSLRNWLRKKSPGRPGLMPEMRGLIDSFDAHLQKPPVGNDGAPRHAEPKSSASEAETDRGHQAPTSR